MSNHFLTALFLLNHVGALLFCTFRRGITRRDSPQFPFGVGITRGDFLLSSFGDCHAGRIPVVSFR